MQSLQVVFTAVLAYAVAAPSHLVPFSPLTVGTIAYKAAIPSGDIQAAAIDAQVKWQAALEKARQISEQAAENLNVNAYSNVAINEAKLSDAFWANEDKKWQTLDAIKTAEAQLDGAIASNAAILAKGAAITPLVGAVSPYSAVPAISSGDIQAAAIDAHVKYADLAQAAVDKARQISETAQAQWDNALTRNINVLTNNAFASGTPLSPVVYPGFVAPATKSISNQFLVQSHPATSEVKASENSAEVDIAGKAAEAGMSTAQLSMTSVDANIKSAESEKSETDKSAIISETGMASNEKEISAIEKSSTMGETIMNSAESEKLQPEKPMKSTGTNMNSAESTISDIEKSVKNAEAALEAAKSEADKAFAALKSPILPLTGDLKNAYLIPSVYSSVHLGHQILNPLQSIVPVVGQTYLKTLC